MSASLKSDDEKDQDRETDSENEEADDDDEELERTTKYAAHYYSKSKTFLTKDSTSDLAKMYKVIKNLSMEVVDRGFVIKQLKKQLRDKSDETADEEDPFTLELDATTAMAKKGPDPPPVSLSLEEEKLFDMFVDKACSVAAYLTIPVDKIAWVECWPYMTTHSRIKAEILFRNKELSLSSKIGDPKVIEILKSVLKERVFEDHSVFLSYFSGDILRTALDSSWAIITKNKAKEKVSGGKVSCLMAFLKDDKYFQYVCKEILISRLKTHTRTDVTIPLEAAIIERKAIIQTILY